ncbi:hypothetical protein DUNSADRAFT_8774 [Dunaliella salina]|uniref:Golgin candidate 6 n=1 Tax=Dunaliella salina TaxID=3046 RepID=A0ABQ7GIU0_DUNSA|nr:hypothetical protein DUNSADRAFT_8774 [Dunaliella salina]|eukprot:KAF5834523.1 hypothetical protein DUNSADRAFT_8774 [Dunaliella salina]
MDMLAEREIIRNEALVLLVALTHANEEVQKIAAFEGAFDRVFHIIREEGGADGGVVVQDCLELLNNLLRANEVGEDSGLLISQQKASILLCALETVMLLVAPMPEARSAEAATKPQDQQSGSRQANTRALLQQGMLEVLLPLCLKDGGVASPAVSAQSLSALGDLVIGNKGGQQKLGACAVAPKPGVPPVPVLQAALRVALHNPEPSKRAAAEHVVQAFCQGNPEGQVVLASTLMPVQRGSIGMPSTFGGELAAALRLGSGGGAAALEVSCRAASVLQHLLAGNAAVKERLLQLPVELPPSPSAPSELLLQRCFRLLSLALQSKEPSGHASTLLLLRLLLVWLDESPTAIARTVANAGSLPLLVDVINSRQGPDCARVQGLAAVLLGVCMLYGHHPASCTQQQSPPQQPQQLQQQYRQQASQQTPSPMPPSDLVRSQAALKTYPSSAPHPSYTPGSNNSISSSSQSHGGGSSFPFDRAFTVFVRGIEGQIRQHIIHAFARPKAPTGRHVAAASPADLLASLPGIGEAEKLCAAAEAMLRLGQAADELQAHNLALKQDLGRAAQQQQQQLQQRLSSGQSQPATDAQVRAQAEERAGNAEAELAAVRQQVELLSARLAQAEQDAAAAQEASATSFSHAAKCEGDLNALGDHCRMMEAQIRELQALLAQAHQQIQQQQELQRQQQEQAPASIQGGVPEDEVVRRVEEAVAKAVAEADANNEEQLTDLLVCLGQEEQKVSALREKLAGFGVDVEALLASIQPEEEGEEGGEDGDELR